jgi:TPP-dependent 2-oxoacid decarboxylase
VVSTPTVAKQLIDVLCQAGVERVYGIVGDSLNPVVDAIRRTGGIEWVHVRNEVAIPAPTCATSPAQPSSADTTHGK